MAKHSCFMNFPEGPRYIIPHGSKIKFVEIEKTDPKILFTVFHLCRDCQHHGFICYSGEYVCGMKHWEGTRKQDDVSTLVEECKDYKKEPYYEPNPLAD